MQTVSTGVKALTPIIPQQRFQIQNFSKPIIDLKPNKQKLAKQ